MHVKKSTFLYVLLLVVGIVVSFGLYIVLSWMVLQYRLLREENIHREISLVAQNASNTDIAMSLMNEWLSEYRNDIYVENKIESYSIDTIKLEEEHDDY